MVKSLLNNKYSSVLIFFITLAGEPPIKENAGKYFPGGTNVLQAITTLFSIIDPSIITDLLPTITSFFNSQA